MHGRKFASEIVNIVHVAQLSTYFEDAKHCSTAHPPTLFPQTPLLSANLNLTASRLGTKGERTVSPPDGGAGCARMHDGRTQRLPSE